MNDCPPSVESSVITGVVSAEARRGLAIARVIASDADLDPLQYRLHDASERISRAITIDEQSGVIRVDNARALSQLADGGPLALNVSVSDGAHATFARVRLTLEPSNRHAPRFLHMLHEARALENQPPPLLVTTVSEITFYHRLIVISVLHSVHSSRRGGRDEIGSLIFY